MMILYGLVILISVVLDQLVKWWVVQNISLGETIGQNPIMTLTFIKNEGAAWSILEGKLWFFVLITIIALTVFPYMLYKNRNNSKWLTVGLSLIIGGTIGNFIDRVRLNYVVDMFQTEFIRFPIFNVADVALSIGVACLFFYLIFIEGKAGSNKLK